MFHYGKIVDGKLVSAPIELYTEDNLVIEFKTHEDYMTNGYKYVSTTKPYYNKDTHNLILVGFEETEDMIRVQYEVRNKSDIGSDLEAIYEEEINKE